MGLLALGLEMSRGGKRSSCNGTNTPSKILMDFKKKSPKKERCPSPSGSSQTGGQKPFLTSGTLTVVHPGVEAFVHVCACERVCARTWLFLLVKLLLKTCNLEGLTVSRGRDAVPLPKKHNNVRD